MRAALPAGFLYRPNVLTAAEEADLVSHVRAFGVLLLAACRLRFRRGAGAARPTPAAVLEPRSAYVLAGEARWQWQHSIPPLAAPRYSITFRTLRARSDGAADAPIDGRCRMAPVEAGSAVAVNDERRQR
jgi:hypothetical protein